MDKFSFLGNSEINSIDAMYKLYLQNPESVEENWRNFFKGFEFAHENFRTSASEEFVDTRSKNHIDKEFMVSKLIRAYRQRGHFFTKTNPVRQRRQYFPTLDIQNFGLSDEDRDTVFHAGTKIGIGAAKLSEIEAHLNETYCNSIGVEYIFIRQPEIVEWLQRRMESTKNKAHFSTDEKKFFFHHLKEAVGFEKFIHKKFVGQKRFSLEGAEALIPALNSVIEHGAETGIEEFIIGMAHRGRLNVLVNIMQKPYEEVFHEFMGTKYDSTISLGDVKYHLGYGKSINTKKGKKVRLNLVPNPSHLEMAGAVIQGISKSKILHRYEKNYKKVAPIIVHGDAAIAAQGIVYEIIQMSQLDGYKTGGTIHLVINNQVGFTTNYLEARSSTYCTDIAKVTRSPIFHVNGDDVEALVYTIKLAMEYRQRFGYDVFIDILCYRKYGHNEGDEPRFTQPTLYKAISKHPNIRDLYAQELLKEKVFSKEEILKAQQEFDILLEQKLKIAKDIQMVSIPQFLSEDTVGLRFPEHEDFTNSPRTGVSKEKIVELARKLNTLPKEKKFFKKVHRIVNDRLAMVEKDTFDWALGEQLAFASLLSEGYPVRISGQDAERGTFAHRHAAFVLEDNDEKYFPLKNINDKQADFNVYNSLLSEYGVLGFEYGYALAEQNGLTIWEAQFGDFHNVAQAIVDQYISSAEEKWGLMNGLVLLLPHGFEGQGPEHSSARIERFLSMAARNNMQIVNCTTPANFFHVLRRQLHRDFRIPLVVFSPKSLLRHPLCVSKAEDFSTGGFQELIDDDNVDVDAVTRVVLCSGKVYYDLLKRKTELGVKDIALVRIEQLHPFPMEKMKALLKKYKNKILTLWVQEEPENMGAWRYIRHEMTDEKLIHICRVASASPAVGLHAIHTVQQNEIIDKVFRKCECELKNTYCGLQCLKGSLREEILKQRKYLFKDVEVK